MNLEEVIAGISKHRQRIHDEHMWSDPISLSDTMTKLAVYNNYLADEIAPAHKAVTDRAYTVFNECRQTNRSVTESERMSKGETTEDRLHYERLKLVYTATANLITVLQSRLKVIENQRRQEGVE